MLRQDMFTQLLPGAQEKVQLFWKARPGFLCATEGLYRKHAGFRFELVIRLQPKLIHFVDYSLLEQFGHFVSDSHRQLSNTFKRDTSNVSSKFLKPRF